MDAYLLPFTVRDALLCLLFLLGIIAGIIAINRKQSKVGGLVVLGFVLLAIDPIAEFVIFSLISPVFSETTDFAVFNWSYACLSSLADIGGFLALLTAIFSAIRPQQIEPSGSSNEVISLPEE